MELYQPVKDLENEINIFFYYISKHYNIRFFGY